MSILSKTDASRFLISCIRWACKNDTCIFDSQNVVGIPRVLPSWHMSQASGAISRGFLDLEMSSGRGTLA